VLCFLFITSLGYSAKFDNDAAPSSAGAAGESPDSRGRQDTGREGQRGESVKKKKKFKPEILIGPFFSYSLYNISANNNYTIPEQYGNEFSGGVFVDFRVTERVGFKALFEFQLPKSIAVTSLFFRYNLALKHQLWAGFGITLHITDSFTTYENNYPAYTSGVLSSADTDTGKKIIYFFSIAMGYYLKVTETLFLDFQASYGIINNRPKSYRYHSLRINAGVGFKL
jgi:hypothetical protein